MMELKHIFLCMIIIDKMLISQAFNKNLESIYEQLSLIIIVKFLHFLKII